MKDTYIECCLYGECSVVLYLTVGLCFLDSGLYRRRVRSQQEEGLITYIYFFHGVVVDVVLSSLESFVGTARSGISKTLCLIAFLH